MIATRCNLVGHNKSKRSIFWIFRRLKSNKEKEKFNPCTKALNHFDDFYGAVFLKKWPSVRLGLLSRQKQLAVINNFGDITETEEILKNEGALDMRHVLNILKEHNKKHVNTNDKLKSKSSLDEIILRKRQLEVEKTVNEIFPKDKDLQSKATYLDSVNNRNSHNEERSATYDPEDPKTSLRSDLLDAQVDSSRLILPNSKMQDAVLHDFIPATQLRGLEGFIPEADYYKYYQAKSEMPINIEDELDLNFPENLKAYTFNRGDMTEFSDPQRCANKVYNYLKVDGADLLAALALDIQKEDKVLDLCSGSGNIAFCIFQILPQFFVCIDSPKKNTENVFENYLFDYSPTWKDLLLVTSKQFINENDNNLFDKVLVNVPSTEDKLSVFEKKDNIFYPTAIKKRLELPKIQSSLLTQGLKLVKPGGTVVYSTKTLSPVQNDGVVQDALTAVWQETRMECTVRNLLPALAHMREFFHFADYLRLKFGTLVAPFLPTNFGPRYLCKIVKNH